MKVFEYVVFINESEDETVKLKSEIVVPVTTVVAKDAGAATLLAARAIPEKYMDRLDLLEVAVRPF